MVVSLSWSAFISPRPLKRVSWAPCLARSMHRAVEVDERERLLGAVL